MTLSLDKVLQKAKAPYTKADLEELFHLYGPGLKLLTWRNEKNELAGFALLTLPMRLLGKTVCTLMGVGSDGTLDAKKCFGEVKDAARAMGADTLMGSTWRNPEAFVRKFGAVIDSVNIRWDLEVSSNGTGAPISDLGPRRGLDHSGGEPRGPGYLRSEEATLLAGAVNPVPPRRHKQHRRKPRGTRVA